MDNSFFGFDASIPLDDDGGGRIAEPSEEEYDALNDETFGSAMNGDWEQAHETLVRLTDNYGSGGGDSIDSGGAHDEYVPKRFNVPSCDVSSGESTPVLNSRLIRRNDLVADSDLEINFSGMKIDDMELSFHDSESTGRINMDPSVWAQPMKTAVDQLKSLDGRKGNGVLFPNVQHNPNASNGFSEDFLHHQFSSPFQEQQRRENYPFNMPKTPLGNTKFCTLEDIERNLLIQQAMQKQQHQQEQQQQQQARHYQLEQSQSNFNDLLKPSQKPQTDAQKQQQHQEQQHLQNHQQQQQQQDQQKGPPGFTHAPLSPRHSSNNLPHPHPLMQKPPQHGNAAVGGRLPPGFPLYPPGMAPHMHQPGHPQMPPHPLVNPHGLSPTFMHPHQRPLPNPHLPIALNNFAMHPNFNAMRVAAVTAGIHPGVLIPPSQQPPRIPTLVPNGSMLNHPQHPNAMINMFNMRLMQEIQQNHPLLQNPGRQMQQHPQNAMNVVGNMHHQHQRTGNGKQNAHLRRDGNLPEEYDEYANLMSTRDKHWLIGIQLSQLNTDTPYIDDYYYTVHREKKAVLSGNLRHSQAHKDNQLNHPLTQPRGHAQLILVQLGNKNGTRNGQHRERRSSENTGTNNSGINTHESKTSYIFTPLKFENSLGKLQYGSVTAPRKIIDADIMGCESTSTAVSNKGSGTGSKGSGSSSLQSKNNQASSAVLSPTLGTVMGDVTSSTQRKSRHILLHIETLYRLVLKLEDLDNPNAIATIILKVKKENERIAALELLENNNKTDEDRSADQMRNKFAYEIEKKEDLLAKLIAGITHDKVVAMMNVRKGKTLLRRIMPYIEESDMRWNVWLGVFSSLQNVLKKDRVDAEGLLYALYPEFKKQIKFANIEVVVRISNCIPLNDKKSNIVFCSKFGMSSLVCLIIRAEEIYVDGTDSATNNAHKESWRQFLHEVATSLNRTIQNHTICAAIESDSIQPMTNHFARFKDLKLDSLLALITEAKQQIH